AGIKPSPYRLFCGGLKKRWVRFAYPPYEPSDADAAITSSPLPLLHAKKTAPSGAAVLIACYQKLTFSVTWPP
ncbi:hypothetical protein, partial [Cronobacter malonaticus]|uniref:hypothetical protein n=1 Tax=Cronobacter malonaticus TaxID=413503 RepID=UPI001F20421C